mgnify:CR=1 FL=1
MLVWASVNSTMKISVLKLHRALALFGFAAMLLWGASGLLHPWLTTFGVQQAVFAPPQRALNLNQALPFQQLLKQTGIEQAQSVRLAVGESANLLQVTESQFAPRRYFDLNTGLELPNHDPVYAAFLARHYLNAPYAEIAKVERIEKFSNDYPAVNRLLPVWKFEYGAPLNASVFVDTATGVLADMTLNSAKPEIWSFSMLHKWSFLGGLGRDVQNIVMCVVVVLAMVMMAGFGLRSRRC